MNIIGKPHVASCRHYVPIVTPYEHRYGMRGTDRVVRTWSDAIGLAVRRAPVRGRQTVRQHSGYLLKRVWVVQDVREPSS